MKCEHSEHINKNETNGPKIICNENEVDANSKYEQENMEFKDLEGCFNDEHNKLFENSNTNVSIIPKDQGLDSEMKSTYSEFIPGDMEDPEKDFLSLSKSLEKSLNEELSETPDLSSKFVALKKVLNESFKCILKPIQFEYTGVESEKEYLQLEELLTQKLEAFDSLEFCLFV